MSGISFRNTSLTFSMSGMSYRDGLLSCVKSGGPFYNRFLNGALRVLLHNMC